MNYGIIEVSCFVFVNLLREQSFDQIDCKGSLATVDNRLPVNCE